MYSRRRLLKHMARYSALGALTISGFRLALASESTPEQQLELFMGLSHKLTGFNDLNTELGQYYYQYLGKQPEANALSELLTIYGKNKSKTPAMLLIKTNQEQRGVAQSITQLWYSGWLAPVDDVPEHIKAKAYTESLAWKAMGILPRGVPKGQLWQTIAQQAQAK